MLPFHSLSESRLQKQSQPFVQLSSLALQIDYGVSSSLPCSSISALLLMLSCRRRHCLESNKRKFRRRVNLSINSALQSEQEKNICKVPVAWWTRLSTGPPLFSFWTIVQVLVVVVVAIFEKKEEQATTTEQEWMQFDAVRKGIYKTWVPPNALIWRK